jgi:hypothetical protein
MQSFNRNMIINWGVFPVLAAGAIGLAIGATKDESPKVGLPPTVGTVAIATPAAPAAKPQAIAGEKTVVCDAVPMGDGSIRSWVRVGTDGYPLAVGVTFTESALNNLPTGGGKSCCDGPEFALALPKNIPSLPFQHIVVNWNPTGHPPEGIYTVPHFDFHFYTISADEREAITGAGEDAAKCAKPLAAECVAPGYICPPGTVVPKMGTHYLSAATPELHGQKFTKTFLYGAYDGKINFLEPMITKAYLETRPTEVIPVQQPKQYTTPGHYPAAYQIKFDERTKEYTVSLEQLSAK